MIAILSFMYVFGLVGMGVHLSRDTFDRYGPAARLELMALWPCYAVATLFI